MIQGHKKMHKRDKAKALKALIDVHNLLSGEAMNAYHERQNHIEQADNYSRKQFTESAERHSVDAEKLLKLFGQINEAQSLLGEIYAFIETL